MTPAISLSIIIVSYNTKALLRTALRSVFAQTHGIHYEVIVVDNASQDGSPALVRTEFPQVRVLSNAENLGFAAANNQGIAVSSGDMILLLNPDTEIIDGAIQRTVRFLEDHPRVGSVGCRLLDPDHRVQQSVHSFPGKASIVAEAFFLEAFVRLGPTPSSQSRLREGREREVDVVSGAFFLTRRSVVDSIGPLDERFFMYSEEVDFCYRARKAGFQVWYYPKVEIIHRWQGVSAMSRRSRHWVLRSQIMFLQKHCQGSERVVLVLLKLAGMSMRIVLYSLTGLLTLNAFQLKKAYYTAYAISRLLRAWPDYHRGSATQIARAYLE